MSNTVFCIGVLLICSTLGKNDALMLSFILVGISADALRIYLK